MATRYNHPTSWRGRKTALRRGKLLGALGCAAGAIALFSATSHGGPSLDQSVCGPHNQIIERLGRVHAERPMSAGLSADGRLIEIVVSASGSWTLLVTGPDNLTCMLAAGEDWENIPSDIAGRTI